MAAAGAPGDELRVLVLAPIGRDAQVLDGVLREAGLASRTCGGVPELCAELDAGAGALFVAAEALVADRGAALARRLASQEPWSDVPVVVATAGDARVTGAREWAVKALERAGSVTVLERPIRRVTVVTVLRSALRARERQYRMRALLEELRVGVERLDAERVMRERFVSLLAHDLRGPLGAAAMTAQLLVRSPERLLEQRELAVRIERNVLRAELMIRDLLDANRLRAGQRLPLDLRRCDLADLAKDVVAELDDADRRRVKVTAPAAVEGVWAPDQLRRALWNLVTNALKYGAAGAPVEVAVGRAADQAVVSVHDAGPGIPPEEQPRLFEPFARARGAEAGGARGWGLGLVLVRGCAEAHGGTVELASAPGAGTTFTVRLPFDARPFQA